MLKRFKSEKNPAQLTEDKPDSHGLVWTEEEVYSDDEFSECSESIEKDEPDIVSKMFECYKMMKS